MYTVASADCQAFLRFALSDLGQDCMVLSFLPLPANLLRQFPERLLAPLPGRNVVDLTEVERLARFRPVILAVHIVGDRREKEAAYRILRQLCVYKKWITVFVALVIPNDMQPDREIGEAMLNFQDELMTLSVADDVLIDPEMTPGFLEHWVHAMLKSHAHMIRRMAATLQQEPAQVKPQEVADLTARQQTLLWEGIPNILMPHFPLLNKRLAEDNNGVGEYRFIRRYACHAGLVLMATANDNTPVAVKVISKAAIDTPDGLEFINREIRFLNEGLIVHPNIARGRDCLHTENYVYIILDHHGSQNLEHYCASYPGRRVPEDEARNCLLQLANALGYLHHLHVAHRTISLHHVVVKKQAESLPHYTLVDFRSTVIAKEDVLSDAFCGSFPCMAPEVVSGEGYIPRCVDRWSVGILLLEIAGGLGSLRTCSGARFNEEHVLDSMQAITNFFQTKNCHATALAAHNGVNHPLILEFLEGLLVLMPSKRMTMNHVYRVLDETKKGIRLGPAPCIGG